MKSLNYISLSILNHLPPVRHVKPYVNVEYVTAFSEDRFAYFLFSESSLAEDALPETRVARTCLSDQVGYARWFCLAARSVSIFKPNLGN